MFLSLICYVILLSWLDKLEWIFYYFLIYCNSFSKAVSGVCEVVLFCGVSCSISFKENSIVASCLGPKVPLHHT